MNDIVFFENQIVIMEALLCVSTVDNETKKKLREQIMFTQARIRALS